MDILAALTLTIMLVAALWLLGKLIATLLFKTLAGAAVGLCWGMLWGLAAAQHFGWIGWSPIAWAAIPFVAHVVGWFAGMGAGLLVFFLLKDNLDDPRVIAVALLLFVVMLPAIVAAMSMYLGFLIFCLVAMVGAFGSYVRR